MSSQGRGQRLRGRTAEFEILRGLISTVHAGSHQVLVLRGEAGVGKTALLGYVSELASDYRCVQVAGVQSDMELAFAGLQTGPGKRFIAGAISSPSLEVSGITGFVPTDMGTL